MRLRVIPESILQGTNEELQEAMRASGVVPVNDKFEDLYNLPAGTNLVVLIGGRGGSKTYEASRFVTISACIYKKRSVILRDEKDHVKESIMNEILQRYDDLNEYWAFQNDTDRLDNGIKDRTTGEMLVFSKGFRASAKAKKANLKSISDIDIAVVEEAEDIRDEEQFNRFADSIRNEGALIIVVLNTPDVNHWIIKRYFNLVVVEDGFFDIVPKDIPGFFCIKTSFEDNIHLSEAIVTKYRSYGDPTSHLYNPYYYKSQIKGYATTGRKGQILTKVKPIKLIDYLKLPFPEIYGQDFGTASPAGLVGLKFDKNRAYIRQLNYLPKDIKSLGKMYCTLGFGNKHRIIADSAEPDSIDQLKTGWKPEKLSADDLSLYPGLLKGFFVDEAKKGPGSVEAGISLMLSMELHAVEESTDLWNEINNYIWAVDRNGNPTGLPVDEFNHLIDPARYVIMDHKGYSGSSGLKGKMGYFR